MTRRITLTGQRFAKLMVISFAEVRNGVAFWLCQCDCGKMKVISSQHLKSGATRSCGCWNRESKIKNLCDKRFGRLVVVERGIYKQYKYKTSKGKQLMWKCKCDCGKIKFILGSSLRAGNSKSCGCLKSDNLRKRNLVIKDMAGIIFGRLKVISFSHMLKRKNGKNISVWKCKCDCGNIKKIPLSNLLGNTKSCGCYAVSVNLTRKSKTLTPDDIPYELAKAQMIYGKLKRKLKDCGQWVINK